MRIRPDFLSPAWLILFSSALAVQGQTLSTWQGGAGAWLDATKWTPNGVPNSAVADIYIDNQPGTNSVVSLGITNLTFGRLRIDAGDRVDTTPGIVGIAVSSNGFAGAGELLLNGTFAISQNLFLDGTKTINGSGKWVLGSSQAVRPEITGVTNNNATIEGAAKFGRLTNNSYPGTINNTGTVHANLTGAAITFNSASNSTNTGTMLATNGATLDLNQGTLNNAAGQIKAEGPFSIVRTGGFTITGGSLAGNGGGEIRIEGGGTLKDLTISGTAQGGCLVGGTITNNGTWHVPEGAGIDLAFGTSAVTLASTPGSGGELVLNAAQDNLPELINQGNQQWTFQGLTVRGRGNVGYPSSNGTIDAVSVINRGTFQADISGQTLLIDVAAFDNRSGGILRATGPGTNTPGGTLQLAIGTTLKNTGGTIEALNLGRIKATQASLSRIEGGLVRNNGGFIDLNGMTLANPGTGMTLEGELTLGDPAENQQAGLVGVIENKGILNLKGSAGRQALLIVGENTNRNVTLTGGGSLVLGDAANGSSTSGFYEPVSGTTLVNSNHTIRGFGFIGNRSYDPGLTLQNSSLVTANVAGRTLDTYLSGATNAGGTFSAAGGGTLQLQVRSGFNNTGGLIKADGGTVTFQGGTRITNGTLLRTAGKFNLSNAILVNGGSGITLEGAFEVDSSRDVGLVGEITNKGTIHLLPIGSARSSIAIGLPGTLTNSITGGGELVLGDAASPQGNPRIRNANEAYNNVAFTLNDQTLRGFGFIGYNEYDNREMLLTNNGKIRADVPGKELALVPKTLINSPNTVIGQAGIRAIGGGSVYFNPVSLTNTGAIIRAESGSKARFDGDMVLIGGTVESQVGGTMEFMRHFTAQGGVKFENAGTALFGAGNGSVIFEGLANGGSTLTNSGTIRKIGSGEYSLRTGLVSTGAMSVDGGVLKIFGGTITGGSHTASAAGTQLRFQDAPFTFAGNNSFSGAGNIWFSNNTITLANPTTTLDVSGNLSIGKEGGTTLTGAGTVNVGGGLSIHPNPTNFSGVKLITGAASSTSIDNGGSSFQFSNGANWENSGRISMGGYINVLSGNSGAQFKNLPGGVFRITQAQDNRLEMSYENAGEFFMDTGSLKIKANGTFKDGSARLNAGMNLFAESSTITFQGEGNTSTGAGLFAANVANFNFEAGAKLTGENIGLFGVGNVTGPGTLEITKSLQIGNEISPYGVPAYNLTFGGTRLRILPGATAGIGVNNSFRGTVSLNSRAVFENKGELQIYNEATFGGDGTGLFQTGYESKTRFHASRTMSWPMDLAGEVHAVGASTATFDQGGLFNETAKFFTTNQAPASIVFTGEDKTYRSRGRAVEFSGTGYVNFQGTTLEFLPSTLSTSANGPLHETVINSGSSVAFHGNNRIKSTGTHGTLSATTLVFQTGSQVVNNATLQTSAGWPSTWNAAGGQLTLENGAKFLNRGNFVIQAPMGGFLKPGVTTELTTEPNSSTSLFHNTSTGRLVHDIGNETEFDVDFLNDGFLEFRRGTFRFRRKFSGRGGIAITNGALLSLSLKGVPLEQQPEKIELNSNGKATIELESGQTLAASISSNGAQLVAAGGLNMVAAGGLNMVAAGGGNIVAAGGMNMVAAGGGNLTATGPASFINANQLIGLDGGSMIGLDGGTLISRLSALISNGSSASLSGAQTAMNVAGITANNALANAKNGAQLNSNDTILSKNGGVMKAESAATIKAQGADMVAAGGGNMVAAGGGNMVAAGGGNLAPTGARNRVARNQTGGGHIIAQAGGRLSGSGTFTGAGIIQSGGTLAVGDEFGQEQDDLTWSGNLQVESGGQLEVQIGGPNAGTQYDRISVSGAFTMNGQLIVSFVNGFGVAQNDVFDVAVSQTSVSTSLAGQRVPVANAYGTFLVNIVNGTTLRLSDYQTVPVTFSRWAQRFGLTDPEADPDSDGISNRLEYLTGLDPRVPNAMPFQAVEDPGYLSFSYPQWLTATDAEPYYEASYDLMLWNEPALNNSIQVDVTQTGPEYRTVRVRLPITSRTRAFLRIGVRLK